MASSFDDQNEVQAEVQREATPATAQQDHQLDRSPERNDLDDPAPYPASTDDVNDMNDDGLNGQNDDDLNVQYDDDLNVQYDDDLNVQYDDDLNAQNDDDLNVQYDTEAPDRGPDPDLYDAPFINAELDCLFSSQAMMRVHERYAQEASQEAVRLITYLRTNLNPDFIGLLVGKPAIQIRRVIIRHYIKKRWERLGVWNPLWGIPGRVNQRDIDNPATWTWKWERRHPESDPNHPLRRTIRLRQGLRRAESGPVPLRGDLASDDSPEEAEDFLLSRPFSVWRLEGHEEYQRMLRGYDTDWDIANILWGRWEQRHDWKEEWYDSDLQGHAILGWTWPHENPFSEVPRYDELNSIDDIEFTPSEADALEAIDEELRLEQTGIAQTATPAAATGTQDALADAAIHAVYEEVELELFRAQHPLDNGVVESGLGHLPPDNPETLDNLTETVIPSSESQTQSSNAAQQIAPLKKTRPQARAPVRAPVAKGARRRAKTAAVASGPSAAKAKSGIGQGRRRPRRSAHRRILALVKAAKKADTRATKQRQTTGKQDPAADEALVSAAAAARSRARQLRAATGQRQSARQRNQPPTVGRGASRRCTAKPTGVVKRRSGRARRHSQMGS
ncbi:unnamed protein product [Clonostachys solani]|uniref:Uncharacterized protein n=1 Tax=Clonostachys solani TaxID=160281 RepID=A0A9N9YZU1_9HYPO|nr:unnamed protein product [Clonostachys solani]